MSNYDDFALPEAKMDVSETKVRDCYDPFDKVCRQDTIYYSKIRDQWYYKYGPYFKPIHFHSNMGYWSDEAIYDTNAGGVLVRGAPLESLQARMNSYNKISYDFKRNCWLNSNKQPISCDLKTKKWSDNK